MKRFLSIFMLMHVVTASAVQTFGIDGYKYFIPPFAHLIRGQVMGERGDYAAVRYEDIAWIMNAYEERWLAQHDMGDFAAGASNLLATTYNSDRKTVGGRDSLIHPVIESLRSHFDREPARNINRFGHVKSILDDDVKFSCASNRFSNSARLIETNLFCNTSEPSLTGLMFTVSRPYTFDTTNGTVVVANSYTSTSNSAFFGGMKQRKLDVEDFCYEDYNKGTVSFKDDVLRKTLPPQTLLSRCTVTNAFSFFKYASNISPVKGFNQFEIMATNRIENYNVRYEPETWTEYVGGGLISSEEAKGDGYSILTYSQGGCIKFTTPIKRSAYEALDEKIPIKGMTVFALLEVSWLDLTENNSSSRSFRVMVPVGYAETIEVPESQDDYIRFKMDLSGSMVDSIISAAKTECGINNAGNYLISVNGDNYYVAFHYEFETKLNDAGN